MNYADPFSAFLAGYPVPRVIVTDDDVLRWTTRDLASDFHAMSAGELDRVVGGERALLLKLDPFKRLVALRGLRFAYILARETAEAVAMMRDLTGGD